MTSEILLGNNHYATVGLTNAERYAADGYVWRMGTGLVTLAATTNYVSINFTTPSTGTTIYAFSAIEKTGDDLTVSLIEGGTYTGGSAISLYNYNRIIGDSVPPFAAKYGLSTGGATVTGGVLSPIRYVPGTTSGGSSQAGNSNSEAGFFLLKPNTSYTLVITAIGSSTKVNASLDIAYIPVIK